MIRSPGSSTRRSFVGYTTALGATLPTLLPSLVRAVAPHSKLQIAGIGIGGKGWGDIRASSVGHHVVAICDPDRRALDRPHKRWPKAKAYSDFRECLDDKNVHAATISTPDHLHAPITMTAMQRGIHTFTQKPLTHSIYEARQIAKFAKANPNVITQMGNQGRSGVGYRMFVQLVQAGAIGKVQEAHAWTDRPLWPQGMSMPKRVDRIPSHLDWNQWVGPAPMRPYTAGKYHVFTWRGWQDFGTGAQGDMAAHLVDPVLWALELSAPLTVTSLGPAPNKVSYPKWSTINYTFNGTKRTAEKVFPLTWYDGGKKPPRDIIPLDKKFRIGKNGVFLKGQMGSLLIGHTGSGPQLLPIEQYRGYKYPKLERLNHYTCWSNAAAGTGPKTTASTFEEAAFLTETVLLGNIAIRYPNQTLQWEPKTMTFKNNTDAARWIRRKYRKGHEVHGL